MKTAQVTSTRNPCFFVFFMRHTAHLRYAFLIGAQIKRQGYQKEENQMFNITEVRLAHKNGEIESG